MTHCVLLLANVPPLGFSAFLIQILQTKRSAAGPHCCKGKETYNRSKYTIGILTLIRFGHVNFVWNNALLHVLSPVSPPLSFEREGVFTNDQYRWGCSISIKMASQPWDGTIANKPTHKTLYPTGRRTAALNKSFLIETWNRKDFLKQSWSFLAKRKMHILFFDKYVTKFVYKSLFYELHRFSAQHAVLMLYVHRVVATKMIT